MRGWGAAIAAGAGSAAANVALLAVSGWLIVAAADQPPLLTLMVAIVGVRAFGLARAGLRWLERLSAHGVAFRLAEDTRLRLWRALTRQGPAADRTPGHALARLVGDVDQLRDLSVRVRIPPVVAGATALLTCAAMALVSPAAAAVATLLLGLSVAVAFAAHRGVARGAEREEARLRAELLGQVSSALDASADLRAHGRVEAMASVVERLGRDTDHAIGRGIAAGAVANAVLTVGCGLAGIAAAWVAATANLSGPACTALALAPLALTEPLQASVAALRRHAAWRDTRERIDAVLRVPGPAEPAAPVASPAVVHDVSVRQLTAGWPGAAPVLRDVCATAHRGDGWLIVRGPSGSGKSTLLAVLMAALRPRGGEYRFGETPAASLSGDDIRRHIAWCPQDPHIFASTIRANLTLGLPDDVSDVDSRLWTALRQVGLDALVAGLPDGLDTHVGSGGTRLSGGERRRLAVARTLLTERDVVLLDEPTAHLDPPTARALITDLRRVLGDRTVVCVTHDPAVRRPGDTVLDLTPRHRSRPRRAGRRRRAGETRRAAVPARVRESSGDRLRHATPGHQPLDA